MIIVLKKKKLPATFFVVLKCAAFCIKIFNLFYKGLCWLIEAVIASLMSLLLLNIQFFFRHLCLNDVYAYCVAFARLSQTVFYGLKKKKK